jgi:hypothetical protein
VEGEARWSVSEPLITPEAATFIRWVAGRRALFEWPGRLVAFAHFWGETLELAVHGPPRSFAEYAGSDPATRVVRRMVVHGVRLRGWAGDDDRADTWIYAVDRADTERLIDACEVMARDYGWTPGDDTKPWQSMLLATLAAMERRP